MSILYKKEPDGGILKYQTGDKSSYIYTSAEEASKDPRYQGVRTHNAAGNPICFGSACRMAKKHGFDYRPEFYKNFASAPRNPGDDDNVVDAWDALNAAKSNPEYFEVLYERGVNTQEELEKLKANLPYGAMIQTGDARKGMTGGAKAYVDGVDVNPVPVSRHSTFVAGYKEDGTPIIYDIGKYRTGIHQKYKGKINSIIVRRSDKKYFRDPVTAPKELETKKIAKVDTPKQKEEKVQTERIRPEMKFESTPINRNYHDSFMSLLKRTFSIQS